MCLEKIDEKVEFDSGVGYKVFDRVRNPERPGENFKGEYYVGQIFGLWEIFKDTKTKPLSWNGITYPCGYHVFMELQHAMDWCRFSWADDAVIIKVAFRDVVATGAQKVYNHNEDCKVAVAREIFLLEEIC